MPEPPVVTLAAAAGLAALLGGVMALATPAILARLPIPPDEAGPVAPFAELGTRGFRWGVFAAAAIAGLVSFGLSPVNHWTVWAPLAGPGSLLALIDLRTSFLPSRLVHATGLLALAGLGVASVLDHSWQPLLGGLAWSASAAGFFWLFWRLSGGGLAFGDVRLAGVIGLVTGSGSAALTLWSFLLGSFVGAAWGVGLRWWRRADEPFPYGPALLLGPPLALLLSSFWPPG